MISTQERYKKSGFDVILSTHSSAQMYDNNEDEATRALTTLWSVLPDIKLNNIQTTVFVEAWQGKTYQQISESHAYDSDYLKDVGHRLWRLLSKALGENCTKHNFRALLRKRAQLQEMPATHESVATRQGSGVVPFRPRPEKTSGFPSHVDLEEPRSLDNFYGRQAELLELERWVVQERKRLIGLFGLGGMGKTTLALRLIDQVQPHFEHVVGRSLRNKPDFESFLRSIIARLDNQATVDFPRSRDQQVALLIQCLTQKRCLLFIDEWSAVLEPSQVYRPGSVDYGFLLRRLSEAQHQSCVIIASQEIPRGLAFMDSGSSAIHSFYVKGFDQSGSLDYLRALGLQDTDAALERLRQLYSGNPRVLTIVSRTINEIFGGSISKFLETEDFIYGHIRMLLEKQFERLSPFEVTLMQKLAQMGPDGCNFNEFLTRVKQEENLLPPSVSLIGLMESLYNRCFIYSKQGTSIMQPQILKLYTLKYADRS